MLHYNSKSIHKGTSLTFEIHCRRVLSVDTVLVTCNGMVSRKDPFSLFGNLNHRRLKPTSTICSSGAVRRKHRETWTAVAAANFRIFCGCRAYSAGHTVNPSTTKTSPDSEMWGGIGLGLAPPVYWSLSFFPLRPTYSGKYSPSWEFDGSQGWTLVTVNTSSNRLSSRGVHLPEY